MLDKLKNINWLKELKEVGLGLLMPFTGFTKEVPFVQSTWRRMGTYFAAWWLAFPMTAMLFPKAEDVFRREGLDPALVQELAPGVRVHVREDNLVGTMHALLDRGPVMMPLHFLNSVGNDTTTAAYAKSALMGSVCTVYLKSHERIDWDRDANQVIAQVDAALRERTGGRYGFQSLVTNEEANWETLVHEVSHCARQNNMPESMMREADATARGVDALARSRNDPALRQRFVLEYIANPRSENYRFGLYLDAAFNGVALPTTADMRAVDRAQIRYLFDYSLARQFTLTSGKCEEFCQELQTPDVPPRNHWEERAYELTRQGVDRMFAPVTVSGAQPSAS